MIQEKTTIYDIAKKLNVTPSTVSRALSDHPRISKKTKERVKEVANALNYQQNSIAAALRSGRTKTLGVIVPTVNRTFFSSLIRGIEQVARTAGYHVMICQSNDDPTLEKDIINTLLGAQVDGIIASLAKSTNDYSHYENLKVAETPLVMVDRATNISNTSTVVIDDFLGAYTAVEHLIHQGCRRIAHFGGSLHLDIYKNRFQGYQQALLDNGISYDENLVICSDLELQDGRAGMKALLKLSEPPDAVLSASDYAAVGAMEVLKERGINIPDEVALVGFMNELFTAFTEPKLSSINQQSEQMGQIAAHVFLEEIKLGTTSFTHRKTVLTPDLVIRASSMKKK